jgi:glycosyltransferase involved in cell wall biosynthesis
MRAVFWGTYDLGKPRLPILLEGLRRNGVEVIECHADPWRGVADKSQISGLGRRLGYLLRWLLAYPGLLWRYLRLELHDVVIVGYLGQIDVLLLWPLARLRGVPVVWDVLLSLYNTVVEERALVGPRHPLALLLYALEWLGLRAADRVVFVTRTQEAYFQRRFGVRPDRTRALFVGAESGPFPLRSRRPAPPDDAPVKVLFYGQFIPLHGAEVIVRAAQALAGEPFEWVIIGKGQEEQRIRRLLDERPVPHLTWVPWVEYETLRDWIDGADVCLGIFGDSDNAAMVIPNKVYQVIATGTPLITRDAPALRELIDGEEPGLYLVPPGDPAALVDALRRFRRERAALAGSDLFPELRVRITPEAMGARMVEILTDAVAARR